MGENSKIQWTHHTMNPWRGCTKVSPGCAHCYAERQSKRNPAVLGVWGDQGTRVVASEAYWRQPIRWNAEAAAAGERRRVFCASLADVFEDRPELEAPRRRLYELIAATPSLDWLLLTKRPQNILPAQQRLRDAGLVASAHFPWPNVWLGTSVENQAAADERIPLLLAVPAVVRFLSMEPLLGPVDLTRIRIPLAGESFMTRSALHATDGLNKGKETPGRDQRVGWVIVGGESGAGARPFELDWARSIQSQCDAAGVPWFMKQAGGNALDWSRADPLNHQPEELVQLKLRDRKGGDLNELPASLRVRDFPVNRR